MAQFHCILVDYARGYWQFFEGSKDRIEMEERIVYLKKVDARVPISSDYRIARSKSDHPRDVAEAVRRVNTGETEWKDGRGGDQKTGKKRGNRTGIRYA